MQWQILHRAFAGHATMVLVGDPKQSIYAFRGGDIDTYLAAARTAGTHATLTRNWRSDAPLVDALQVLFGRPGPGQPGDPGPAGALPHDRGIPAGRRPVRARRCGCG